MPSRDDVDDPAYLDDTLAMLAAVVATRWPLLTYAERQRVASLLLAALDVAFPRPRTNVLPFRRKDPKR